MTCIVTTSQLDTLLDLDGNIDVNRAQLLIGLAFDLCSVVVAPVPDKAAVVVLSIAARGYMNAGGVTAETIGPTSVHYGSAGLGGLFLTKRETAALKILAGRGGAFTINPTPVDAGKRLYPWDLNIWWLGGEDQAMSMGEDTTDPMDIGMWS